MSHAAAAPDVAAAPSATAHTIEQLQAHLARHKHVMPVSTLPEIGTALRWLGKCQRDGGFWSEEDDEGTTALCALAAVEWRSAPGAATDARAAADSIDLERTADWLEGRARRGFSTPWYLAVNLRALCALGRSDSVAAVALAKRLGAFDPADVQAWIKRGHHSAQILDALRAFGQDRAALLQWRGAVLRELESDKDMYVTGQMANALLDDGVAFTELGPTIEWLRLHVEQEPLSKQSFMGYMPALLALSTLGPANPQIAQLLDEKTAELLHKYQETAWYNDPEYVAWALLVLRRSTTLVQVIVDVPRFNAAFAQAKKTVAAEQRRVRRRVAMFAGLFATALAAAGFIALLNPSSFWITSLVFGLVVAPTLGWAAKRLYADLR